MLPLKPLRPTHVSMISAAAFRCDSCQYANYTCEVPPIPGCTVSYCVPVPVSAFTCTTDEDCYRVESEGDVCEGGICVACGENNVEGSWAWNKGACNFTLGSPVYSQCAYSQHLLPGYPCPTGGLAPNGWMQALARDTSLNSDGDGSTGFLGLTAGCSRDSIHPGGNCTDGNTPDQLKCSNRDMPPYGNGVSEGRRLGEVDPISGRRQLGATVAESGCCHAECRAGTEHNLCGWDCRDGSIHGVQCPYDHPCLMITSDQTEVTIPMVHNMLTSSRNTRSQVYTITDSARKKLLRPMRCGGTDEQGMRCGGQIIEAIVEEHRAPAPLRERGMDIVTLVFPVPNNNDYKGSGTFSASFTGCPNHTAWDDFNSGELYHTSTPPPFC